MPSPNKLQKAYDEFNAAYFGSRLPTDTILSWSNRLGQGVAGDCDADTIRISSKLRDLRPCWKATLLHEMAHLATINEEAEHGPKWQREMRRLYRAGAFDTLL